ncbi:MAG TPA: HD domain-containing protein [Spirochaetales bacterium]|nr:HD domain-containing protein [Spirochaetales bacterium]
MDKTFGSLAEGGIDLLESSFTALDAYLGLKPAPLRFALASGSLVELAKAAEGLEYPGLSYADAALSEPGEEGEEERRLYIRLADSPAAAEPSAFAPLDLLRDPESGVYHDPKGVYGELRSPLLEPRPAPAETAAFEAAVLLARYGYELPEDFLPEPPRDFPPAAQRDLLELVLTGRTPERAFGFLARTGFVEAYWPELAELRGVGHSKEYHPEGDAWEHTMETFRYRKLPDLRLSLALLLHDTGKPGASSSGGRRFDRHAEIGRAVAARFLARLGFGRRLSDDVAYLVRYHMLPAALPRLPLGRGIEGLDDPRFPLLLELYKCDELSTFRGPDGYYESCAAYRAYLRNSRNPYRGPEGRKLARTFLEGSAT